MSKNFQNIKQQKYDNTSIHIDKRRELNLTMGVQFLTSTFWDLHLISRNKMSTGNSHFTFLRPTAIKEDENKEKENHEFTLFSFINKPWDLTFIRNWTPSCFLKLDLEFFKNRYQAEQSIHLSKLILTEKRISSIYSIFSSYPSSPL